MSNAFLRLLGLSVKAGRAAIGEGKAQDAVRRGEAYMIVLSDDAAANTAKKFSDMSRFHGTPLVRAGDRFKLGSAVGRDFAVVIAVTDRGFAKRLAELA